MELMEPQDQELPLPTMPPETLPPMSPLPPPLLVLTELALMEPPISQDQVLEPLEELPMELLLHPTQLVEELLMELPEPLPMEPPLVQPLTEHHLELMEQDQDQE